MSFHSWEQCQVQKNAVSFDELHLCILILFKGHVIHYLITYEIISLLILMFGKTKSLLKSRLETMKKK